MLSQHYLHTGHLKKGRIVFANHSRQLAVTESWAQPHYHRATSCLTQSIHCVRAQIVMTENSGCQNLMRPSSVGCLQYFHDYLQLPRNSFDRAAELLRSPLIGRL